MNARLLCAPALRGWGRYTINLLAELPALGTELFLYSDHPLHADHLSRLPKGSYSVRVAPPMRYFRWEQQWLPRQCAVDRADVLHSPFNFGLPWSSCCPRVLTLHDAIDHIYYRRRTPWRQRAHPKALQSWLYGWIARTRSHHVVTVSEHAKSDLVNHLGIAAEMISVIYEAAEPRFRQPRAEAARNHARARYQLTKPYVFYIGGWEKRKNVSFLMRAFAAADLSDVRLVLAGGTSDQRAELARMAHSLNIADRVRLLEWVVDDDLPALYAEAMCFVYPSEYEGFGLQLCEAMAAGCPTLAARAASLPEVLGSGGDTFAVDNTSELSALLRRIARNPTYRAELAARAIKRAEDFSWRRTAEQTLAVYRQVVESA